METPTAVASVGHPEGETLHRFVKEIRLHP
jgi:hypothetical protein